MPDAPTAAAVDPAAFARLQHLAAEQHATIRQQQAQIEQLQAKLDWLVRQHFGRRSERLSPEQPLLFAEPEGEPEPPPPPPPAEEVVVKKKGHGRRAPRRDLPREEEVLDVPEAEKTCPCCGSAKVCIGRDTTERHDYQPPKVFIRATIRPTYICRTCERNGDAIQVSQAPLPPEPIPRSLAAPGLLAHLIVAKYVDHLPLYRQEHIFARLGWTVSRSTLGDLVAAGADVLNPICALMGQRVRQSFALHADDSPVTLLDPRRKAYAWVYVGDAAHPYTVFDLSPGRLQEYPLQFLRGYRGFLQADAYAGYNPLYEAGATHVGCWMHARRYFFEAKDNDPVRAHAALGRIRQLYEVERELKDRRDAGATDQELLMHRRRRAGPILEEFGAWVAEQVPRVLPKSKIGEAFTYAANQWPTLVRYVADARLSIDNHPAEQALRPLALGRKNWLHIGGDGGLPRAAVLLSLAASAKRHQLRPWEYLKDLLSELPKRPRAADLSDLLPDAWAKSHQAT
jgi:transposase